MALLDFLKSKKEVEKSREKKEIKTEKKAEESLVKKSVKRNEKEVKVLSNEVIIKPLVSEKATTLAGLNKYIFVVNKNFNKREIKNSVEKLHKVNVLGVNIIKIPKKKRRLGKSEGFKKGYSKAVVTIKAGQKIEVF